MGNGDPDKGSLDRIKTRVKAPLINYCDAFLICHLKFGIIVTTLSLSHKTLSMKIQSDTILVYNFVA